MRTPGSVSVETLKKLRELGGDVGDGRCGECDCSDGVVGDGVLFLWGERESEGAREGGRAERRKTKESEGVIDKGAL